MSFILELFLQPVQSIQTFRKHTFVLNYFTIFHISTLFQCNNISIVICLLPSDIINALLAQDRRPLINDYFY